MADKLTQQITDALARAAAQPGGLPLYSSKASAGLFPNTAAAKSAAQKCLTDELISAVAKSENAKPPRELYALTEKGWSYLLAAVNPKQVLEDFVRVLEARQGEVGELLDTARNMADSLQGLKEAVSRVLPNVNAARISDPAASLNGRGGAGLFASTPERKVNEALQTGWVRNACESDSGSPPTRRFPSEAATSPARGEVKDNTSFPEGRGAVVGLLESTALAPAVLTYLAEHSSPTDCPLPELYRALAESSPAPSIGEFHDCLRALYSDGALYLHPWTGPLYELPEPQYALLVGHGIAYYASSKR